MVISTIHFEYTTGCNSKCTMCDYWKNKTPNVIKSEYVTSTIASLVSCGLKKVYFTGGECLLYAKQLFKLCEETKSIYPDLELELITNGILIEKYYLEIGQYFSKVIISLDSVDNEKYKTIRGVDALSRIQKGIHLLRTTYPNLLVNVRMLILNDTVADILPIIEYAASENLHHVSFIPEDISSSEAFGRKSPTAISNHHGSACLAELRNVINTIHSRYSSLFGTLLPHACEDLEYIYSVYEGKHNNFRRCNKAAWSCVINADGTVNPCFFIRANMSLEKGTDIMDILDSAEYQKMTSIINTGNHEACCRCACPKELS